MGNDRECHALENVSAQHHPDEQESNRCDDDIANPLADGSGFGAVFHSWSLAFEHDHLKTPPCQYPRTLSTEIGSATFDSEMMQYALAHRLVFRLIPIGNESLVQAHPAWIILMRVLQLQGC